MMAWVNLSCAERRGNHVVLVTTLLNSITSIRGGHSGPSGQFGKWVIWQLGKMEKMLRAAQRSARRATLPQPGDQFPLDLKGEQMVDSNIRPEVKCALGP